MTLRPVVVVLFLAQVLLAGCANLPGMKQDAVTAELSTDKPPPLPPPYHAPDESKPITIKNGAGSKPRTDSKLTPGTGQLINYGAADAPPPKAASAGSGEITFNFENLPIQAVVQNILGGLLNENYTVSPAVTGNVTFSSSKPVAIDQAMPILEMLLAWTNNALVRKQGRYEVVPVKDAIAGSLSPRLYSVKSVPGYQVRVFPLKYISPKEMEKLLKPYAKPDAIVSADNARAMIVMAGTAFELQNYEHTINIFDVDWLKGMSVGVVGLRNMEVGKLMPELDKMFGEKADTPLAGMFRFIPMEATNSVVVITPQPDYLRRAQEWIYRLDLGVGENGTQLYVYDVKNVKAVDLSDHLNAIFTGKSSGSSKSNSGNTAPGLRGSSIGGSLGSGIGSGAMSINNQQRPATPNLTTTGTGGALAGGGNKDTDIRITAIEENNQLLIMATPGEYDSILAAIHRLDVSPLQVQIEAKVLEVKLTGALNFGVQWWFTGLINQPGGSGDTGVRYGTSTTVDPTTGRVLNFSGNPNDRHRAMMGGGGSAQPPNPNTGGLFYSFLNKNFEVAINALQTDGTAKTLSAPSMVVLNNQQASITVGDQIPIVTTSIVGYGTGTVSNGTNNLGSNTGIGSTSYISTGTTLQITPRVNPGGLVYMDVAQEITTPGSSTAANPNPPISQRNLNTQVAVQSGQTVLLGGLIREDNVVSNTGVPFLSSVPVLGNLFKSSQNSRTRTEIIVLITPRVIYNTEDAQTITQEYQDKFESLAPIRAKMKAKKAQSEGAVPNDGQGAVTTPLPQDAPAATPTPTQKPNL
ncbi:MULTISPECIES: type II secretion system secretin GspD [unclassified Rudaea]|uniref:type II secretion system secretin GspD n=1 Tax=unclassified Rudaea TaxID=2627037 RepID=UPI002016A480|nr:MULTISPECIES: type II secretion system secretin GspD [unclassified Rudaea]